MSLWSGLARMWPLAICAPTAWLAARALVGWSLGARFARTDRSLTCAVALAMSILSVNLLMRAAWVLGLPVSLDASIAATATGMAAMVAAARRVRLPLAVTPLPPPDAEDRAYRLAHATALVAITLMALRNFFWDELDGHMAKTGAILNGIFPPVYPYIPDPPFPYHYGFDLLSAIVHRISGLELWHCFDTVSIICWAASTSLVYQMLRAQAGLPPGCALGGMGLAFFGSGLAWMRLVRDLVHLPIHSGAALLQQPFEDWNYFPYPYSPFISGFFQHPITIGLPIFLGCIDLFLRAWSGGGRGVWVLLAAMMGSLALCQANLFALLYPAVITFTVLSMWREPGDRARTLGTLAPAGLALAGAMALAWCGGGVFTWPIPSRLTMHWREVPGFFHGTPRQVVVAYGATFGLGMLLAPVGVGVAWYRRHAPSLFLAIAGAGSFAIPHLYTYLGNQLSEKYFLIAQVQLGALAGIGLVALLARMGSLRVRLAVGVPLFLASSLSAFLFLGVRTLVPFPPNPRLRPAHPELIPEPPLGFADRPAAAFLLARAAPRDRVLTRSIYLSAYSGLLTPNPWYKEHWAQVLDPDDSLQHLLDEAYRDLDPDVLFRAGFRWLSLGPKDFEALGPRARVSLVGSRFEHLTRVVDGDDWREIYRVRPPGEGVAPEVAPAPETAPGSRGAYSPQSPPPQPTPASLPSSPTATAVR